MYNEDLKRRFFQEKINSQPWKITKSEAVFSAFEPYEEEWKSDLCTKNSEELQPILDKTIGFRSQGVNATVLVLKEYINWCISEGVPNANPKALNLSCKGVEQMREKTVASPLHLQQYLDAICEPEDKKATDNTYRCYYWLAYGGMDEEDILRVKTSDVDFRNMIVKYPQKNTVITIYPEALEAFHNCVELSSFNYIHSNYTKEVFKPRVDGDLLIRGVSAQPALATLRVEMSRRAKVNRDKTPLKLSCYRVKLSGLFYRMYEREVIGVLPNFESIVEDSYKNEHPQDKAETKALNKKKSMAIKGYRDDYDRWKLAWH